MGLIIHSCRCLVLGSCSNTAAHPGQWPLTVKLETRKNGGHDRDSTRNNRKKDIRRKKTKSLDSNMYKVLDTRSLYSAIDSALLGSSPAFLRKIPTKLMFWHGDKGTKGNDERKRNKRRRKKKCHFLSFIYIDVTV